MVAVMPLVIGGNDERRNARARSPTIARGGPHVVPESPVLVVGHDDRGRCPKRACLDPGDQLRDMNIARQDIGVAGVLVKAALWLVERYLWQLAAADACGQLGVILDVRAAVCGAGREACEIIERLVMRPEIRRAVRVGVADLSRRRRLLHSVLQRQIPGASIPGPRYAFR